MVVAVVVFLCAGVFAFVTFLGLFGFFCGVECCCCIVDVDVLFLFVFA